MSKKKQSAVTIARAEKWAAIAPVVPTEPTDIKLSTYEAMEIFRIDLSSYKETTGELMLENYRTLAKKDPDFYRRAQNQLIKWQELLKEKWESAIRLNNKIEDEDAICYYCDGPVDYYGTCECLLCKECHKYVYTSKMCPYCEKEHITETTFHSLK